jgi:hypothetical protein
LKKLLLVGLFAATLGLPRSASAATLTFEGMGKKSIVTIGGLVTGSFYAGELKWDQSAWSDLSSLLYTYCVDIAHEVTVPTEQVTRDSTDNLVPPGPSNELASYAVDAGKKAAWLFNTFAGAVRESGSGIDAAGLQVAIWEALYDDKVDLSSGDFRLVTDNTAYTGSVIAQQIAAAATGYLGQLFNPDGSYHTSTAIWLNSPIPGGQDQITNVPEPASMVLLGAGLASLMAYRRRGTSYAA